MVSDVNHRKVSVSGVSPMTRFSKSLGHALVLVLLAGLFTLNGAAAAMQPPSHWEPAPTITRVAPLS